MRVKQFTNHVEIHNNRLPPSAKYNLNVEADFDNIDLALSFSEDIAKLVAQYRVPAIFIDSDTNANN